MKFLASRFLGRGAGRFGLALVAEVTSMYGE